MTLTPSECCGRAPRAITIDLSEQGTLVLQICDVCEGQQWLKDGVPVEADAVKSAAGATWNRRVRQ